MWYLAKHLLREELTFGGSEDDFPRVLVQAKHEITISHNKTCSALDDIMEKVTIKYIFVTAPHP